jgi:AcrR family transcriptional regulator
MSDNLTVEQSSKELAVLKAATSVFLTHGFNAATTDMIQREAGVSKATMYACFPGKEAMFIAVIERQCAVMSESFKAIRMAPGDIVKTLTDLGVSYLKLVLSPPALALFRVVAAEAPRIPELGRRFYLAGPQLAVDKVATLLTEAVQAGEIDVQTIGIDAAATLFLSLVRGKGLLECLTHPNARPSEAQIDHWVQLAVTGFLRAFGAASHSGTR